MMERGRMKIKEKDDEEAVNGKKGEDSEWEKIRTVSCGGGSEYILCTLVCLMVNDFYAPTCFKVNGHHSGKVVTISFVFIHL